MEMHSLFFQQRLVIRSQVRDNLKLDLNAIALRRLTLEPFFKF